MDLSQVATWVGLAASVALVISVCLLAYNVMATRRDARRGLAFSILEQFTAAGFAERRFNMHRSISQAAAANWVGFDDTLPDFEDRAFAYQYELIGQMVDSGSLDYRLVRDSLQFTVIADWNAFAPLDSHLLSRYPGRGSPWEHFRNLAIRVTTDLNGPPIRPRVVENIAPTIPPPPP